MKKILIVNFHGYPPGKSKWTRHYDLSKELVKKGYEVNIVGSSYLYDLDKQNENLEIEEYDGVKYHKINNRNFSGNIERILVYISFMIKTYFYCKNRIKSDVVIGSSPDLFTGISCYFLSKFYKCPFVFEVRDIWPETWVEMGALTKKSPIYWFFRLTEIFIYKKADRIIGLFPGLYLHTDKNKIDRDKVIWISNGVDLELFDRNSNNQNCQIDFDKNYFNIVYTGAIGKANVLHNLIEVAQKLNKNNKKIMINIVGKGPLEKELIEKSKDIDNIKFWGMVDKYEIPNLLKKSDALVVLMKKGDFYKYGISLNKIYEYMASGKLIIFSGNIAFDFIKENDLGISIMAEDVKKIYEAVIKVYEMNESDRNYYTTRARRYVEDNFEIKKLAEKLIIEIEKIT